MAEKKAEVSFKLPPVALWEHISKLALVEDKPIMFDYWADSVEKKVLIGVKEGGEKLLVKNAEEYTSPVEKIYKVEGCYIICTENQNVWWFSSASRSPTD